MRTEKNHPGHKILSFRAQRALAAFTVALLLITFSIAVIWNHIDGIGSFSAAYARLAKAGLVMVETVAIIFVCWELWARDKALSLACYAAEFLLVIVMLIHAGAVLQLDASGYQAKQTLEVLADSQAKIAAATEAARIKSAAEEAARLNAIGQRSTARRIAQAANVRESGASLAVLAKTAETVKANTFLPESYMSGGLYYWPPLIAFVLFMVVFLISKAALPYEDANANGIPDWMEPWAFRQEDDRTPTQLATRHAYQQPDTGGGFLKKRLHDVESKKS